MGPDDRCQHRGRAAWHSGCNALRAGAEGWNIINLSSVAGHVVFPPGAVYWGMMSVRAISEGLRMKIGPDIRITIISPDAVKSELAEMISGAGTAKNIHELTAIAIDADKAMGLDAQNSETVNKRYSAVWITHTVCAKRLK
jgi:NADP-dependent 3-hydroxy acid dehydrogenase YdfG